MTIIQLQYMLAVAKHKNFTLAAEHSFVTQPTLSMQIQKLEEELQVEIFDRSTHPIGITNMGYVVIEQSEKIIREVHHLKQIINEKKGSIAGRFTVGIIPTLATGLLPIFLKTFLKKYPETKLVFRELKTKDIIEGLKEGVLDAGIAATPLRDPNIEEMPLYYEPMVAYVSQHHSLRNRKLIRVEDIDLEELLLLEEGHCFRNNVINLCNPRGQDKPVSFETGSLELLVKLVNDGMGITLLPKLYAENLSSADQQRVIPFELPPPTRQVSLIYHRSQLRLLFFNLLSKTIKNIIRGKLLLESNQVVSPISLSD